ncbi:hypothetical protein F511_37621 [Dorcoceras hygrometricum]|uniref:Uncharacterized protein n=1 Tax=Dorcoceras hygrometricum TaxID=472368 RepID=A0A2Z7CAD7_9LAMI|nr:hypothetical protein F511_37621 [Dorcoceras hygrometricum]
MGRITYQKLKSERGKPSTGSHEGIRTCNYFAPLPSLYITPNWYQSKELSKTNPAPPILLQTTAKIDGNLTEKGSDKQYNPGFLWKGDRECRVEKMISSPHRVCKLKQLRANDCVCRTDHTSISVKEVLGVLAACWLSDRVRAGAAVIKSCSEILHVQGRREDFGV